MTTDDELVAALRELLIQLGIAMSAAGDSVDAIDSSLRAIIAAYGRRHIEVAVLPTSLMVSTGRGTGTQIEIGIPQRTPLRFDQVAELYTLVRAASSASISPDAALEKLHRRAGGRADGVRCQPTCQRPRAVAPPRLRHPGGQRPSTSRLRCSPTTPSTVSDRGRPGLASSCSPSATICTCPRPARSVPWMLVIMLAAYAGQVAGAALFGALLSGFFGALAMTPLALWVETLRNGPPKLVTFLPGFWLLVPGAAGLIGVTELLSDSHLLGAQAVVDSLVTVTSIALGVLIGTAVYRTTDTGLRALTRPG